MIYPYYWYDIGSDTRYTHNDIKSEIEKKKGWWTVKVANCLNRVTNSWDSMAVVKYSVFGQIIIKKTIYN